MSQQWPRWCPPTHRALPLPRRGCGAALLQLTMPRCPSRWWPRCWPWCWQRSCRCRWWWPINVVDDINCREHPRHGQHQHTERDHHHHHGRFAPILVIIFRIIRIQYQPLVQHFHHPHHHHRLLLLDHHHVLPHDKKALPGTARQEVRQFSLLARQRLPCNYCHDVAIPNIIIMIIIIPIPNIIIILTIIIITRSLILNTPPLGQLSAGKTIMPFWAADDNDDDYGDDDDGDDDDGIDDDRCWLFQWLWLCNMLKSQCHNVLFDFEYSLNES